MAHIQGTRARILHRRKDLEMFCGTKYFRAPLSSQLQLPWVAGPRILYWWLYCIPTVKNPIKNTTKSRQMPARSFLDYANWRGIKDFYKCILCVCRFHTVFTELADSVVWQGRGAHEKRIPVIKNKLKNTLSVGKSFLGRRTIPKAVGPLENMRLRLWVLTIPSLDSSCHWVSFESCWVWLRTPPTP